MSNLFIESLIEVMNEYIKNRSEDSGYQIAREFNPFDLEDDIAIAIKKGWKPIGGVLEKDGLFLQAMIKKDVK